MKIRQDLLHAMALLVGASFIFAPDSLAIKREDADKAALRPVGKPKADKKKAPDAKVKKAAPKAKADKKKAPDAKVKKAAPKPKADKKKAPDTKVKKAAPKPKAKPAPKPKIVNRSAKVQAHMDKQSVETAPLASEQAGAYKQVLGDRLFKAWGYDRVSFADAKKYAKGILKKHTPYLEELNRAIPFEIAKKNGLAAGVDGVKKKAVLYISPETYKDMSAEKKKKVKSAVDQSFGKHSRTWHLINAGLTEAKNAEFALFKHYSEFKKNFERSFSDPLFDAFDLTSYFVTDLLTALSSESDPKIRLKAELAFLRACSRIMDPESFKVGTTSWHRVCFQGWEANLPPVVGELYDFTKEEQELIMQGVAKTKTPQQVAQGIYTAYEADGFKKLQKATHSQLLGEFLKGFVDNADAGYFQNKNGVRFKEADILEKLVNALTKSLNRKGLTSDIDDFQNLRTLYGALLKSPGITTLLKKCIAAKKGYFGEWKGEEANQTWNELFAYLGAFMDHPKGSHLLKSKK